MSEKKYCYRIYDTRRGCYWHGCFSSVIAAHSHITYVLSTLFSDIYDVSRLYMYILVRRQELHVVKVEQDD